MAVRFVLPNEVENHLRQELGDLGHEAYRLGRLSHYELSQTLGLDRFETEEWLHKHNVTEDLGTVEDYFADARTLEELRNTKH